MCPNNTSPFTPSSNSFLICSLFCLSTFALNFGPNVSTYVLPTSAFPQQVTASQWMILCRLGMHRVPCFRRIPEVLNFPCFRRIPQVRGTFHGLSAASGKVRPPPRPCRLLRETRVHVLSNLRCFVCVSFRRPVLCLVRSSTPSSNSHWAPTLVSRSSCGCR